MTTGSEPVRTEDSAKRVGIWLDGELIAGTVRQKLVWEAPYHPVHDVPGSDVRRDLPAPSQYEFLSSGAGFFIVEGRRKCTGSRCGNHSSASVAYPSAD